MHNNNDADDMSCLDSYVSISCNNSNIIIHNVSSNHLDLRMEDYTVV